MFLVYSSAPEIASHAPEFFIRFCHMTSECLPESEVIKQPKIETVSWNSSTFFYSICSVCGKQVNFSSDNSGIYSIKLIRNKQFFTSAQVY